jgi:AAA family ATPase
VDLDVILPGCSLPIQKKDHHKNVYKMRVTVQSIDPLPTEKHSVDFDMLTTQLTTTSDVPAQKPAVTPTPHLQMNMDGIGGLSEHATTINKRLSFFTNALPRVANKHLLGNTSFLLHGPEGTGKSLLLERLADCPWQEVYRVDLGTHPKGQTKAISEAFEEAHENQPSLIVMDNLDRFLDKSESLVNKLRTELAKLEGSQVVVAAAARSIYDIDPSLRTISAFKTHVELFPPNVRQREDMLRQVLGPTQQLTDVDFSLLAERSHGFVGRDIHHLCGLARNRHVQKLYEGADTDKTATLYEVLENADFVEQEDFDAVIDQVQPTVLKDSILEVPKVKWQDIAGLEHVRATLEAITVRPFKVGFFSKS